MLGSDMESLLAISSHENEVEYQPIVSVIIIFFNAEQFIEEAIESVFTQTYSDWELLLVDDGSSDQSIKVAEHYVEQDPLRVRYLEHSSHQNRGKTASRNLGIRFAHGKYIAFLDADDVWLPRKLEQQVAILDAQPEVGMVYGLSQWWYSWTGRSEDQQRDFMHELGVPSNICMEPPTLVNLFFLKQEAAIPTPSDILVRHEVVNQVNGFDAPFRDKYDFYEDQAFYAKVCLRSKVFVTNKCWDKYRQHPYSSSSMIGKTGQGYVTRLFFLNWLSNYLDKQETKNIEIMDAIRNEIWRCSHPQLFKAKHTLLVISRRILPLSLRQWLGARLTRKHHIPTVGKVRFGSLRLTPLSRDFGYDRGQPIDRYYIEQFLSDHQADIHGHVLEIADDTYTCQFGGDRVTKSDVLNVAPGDPKTTLVGDITCAEHISSNTFDCIIFTQTLQLIFEVHAALQTIYRILKPGGIVIATIPGISPISRYDMERWGYYWSFTSLSARRLFEEVFPASNIQIKTYGNVLTASAFLYGIATEELKQEQMEFTDQDYEVIIAVRAIKPDEM